MKHFKVIVNLVFLVLVGCNEKKNPCPKEEFVLMNRDQVMETFKKKDEPRNPKEYGNRINTLVPMPELGIMEPKKSQRIEFTDLPADSDLRKYDSPVRDQWEDAGTMFALNSVQEATHCERNNLCCHDLSVRHRYSFTRRANVPDALEASHHQIVDDHMWPIVKEELSGAVGRYGIESYEIVSGDSNALLKALSEGKHVIFWSRAPQQMVNCNVTIDQGFFQANGHVYEVSGYFNKFDPVLIVKNSWGTKCGDNGYQYMKLSIFQKKYKWYAAAITNTTLRIDNI